MTALSGARARPTRVCRSSWCAKNRTREVLTSRRAREVRSAQRMGLRHCARRELTAKRRPTRRRRRALPTALNRPWRKSASLSACRTSPRWPSVATVDAGVGGASKRTPAVPVAPTSPPPTSPPSRERSQPPMFLRDGDATGEVARGLPERFAADEGFVSTGILEASKYPSSFATSGASRSANAPRLAPDERRGDEFFANDIGARRCDPGARATPRSSRAVQGIVTRTSRIPRLFRRT